MDQGTGQADAHDQGSQAHPRLQTFSTWVLVFLVAGLSFSSAFFYKRYDHVKEQAERLHRQNRALELSKKAPARINVLTPEERAQVEREVRAIYEARDAAITAELNELYDVEARLREKYELPAKREASKTASGAKGKEAVGGQGGGVSVYEGDLFRASNPAFRPPTLIYGLSKPSADLIVQEIRLRTEWFGHLIKDMDRLEEEARIMSRTPSMWPCVDPRARLTSRFGYRRDPFSNSVRHHDGTDVAAPLGSTVVATADGTVVFAGWDGDFGNLVKISHGNGIETWYAHLQKYSVARGQEVKRGDAIGKLGSTGRSTGPHVHYEVRVNGQPVDSGDYLGN